MSKFTREMVNDYADKLLIGLTEDENKMVLDEFDIIDKNISIINNIEGIENVEPMSWCLDDFSCEHLTNQELVAVNGCRPEGMSPKGLLVSIIDMINYYRDSFIEDGKNKDDWWQMIQLLPSSYNQKRTVQLNYQVLKSMYFARKNHKLDEWHSFCEWCKALPYFQEICLGGDNNGQS